VNVVSLLRARRQPSSKQLSQRDTL